MFKLVSPTLEYKEKAIDFINEFYEYKSDINGVGGLYRYLDDYEGWLEKLENDKKQPVTEERVPAETFFLVREEDDKEYGIKDVLLTVDKDNLPSKKTILRFSPRYESEYFDEDNHNCIIQLYWINVEDGIKLWEKSLEEEER